MQPDSNKAKVLPTFLQVTCWIIFVIQAFMFYATCVRAPGYMEPMLHSPACVATIAGLYIFELAAFVFVAKGASVASLVLRSLAVLILCVIPVSLIPMLGPALFTINKAFATVGP